MDNHYEAPEALKLGKAQDVIVDQSYLFREFGNPMEH